MVMYLSKGTYYQNQADIIMINRGMRNAALSGIYSYLWNIGSRRFSKTSDKREIEALNVLKQMGLVEVKGVEGDNDKYELLTHCILSLSDKDTIIDDKGTEYEVYQWLKKAPLNLSIAELIKLHELNVHPTDEWLGKDNLYKLVMKLYEPVSSDRLLEYQMINAKSKDEVVASIEKLINLGIVEMM